MNDNTNISLKSKAKISGCHTLKVACHILKVFEKFHFKLVNTKLVLLKFKPMFESNAKRAIPFYDFMKGL